MFAQMEDTEEVSSFDHVLLEKTFTVQWFNHAPFQLGSYDIFLNNNRI